MVSKVKKAFYPKKPPTNWMAYSRVAVAWLAVGFCAGIGLFAAAPVLVGEDYSPLITWAPVILLGVLALFWVWIALDDARKDGLFELLGYRARCLWFERGIGVGLSVKRLEEALTSFNNKGGGKAC